MVGGKRVPNANPNRPHRDEDDDLTPQTSVGTAFGGSGVSDIAVVHVKTDSEEKAKHDKLHAPHTAHQDQKVRIFLFFSLWLMIPIVSSTTPTGPT